MMGLKEEATSVWGGIVELSETARDSLDDITSRDAIKREMKGVINTIDSDTYGDLQKTLRQFFRGFILPDANFLSETLRDWEQQDTQNYGRKLFGLTDQARDFLQEGERQYNARFVQGDSQTKEVQVVTHEGIFIQQTLEKALAGLTTVAA